MGLGKGDEGDAVVAVKGAGGPPALIDRKSQAEYKNQYEKHRQQNRHSTEAESLHHVNEYIKKKIDGIVDNASSNRKMDLFTTASSVMCGTVVPMGGVPVAAAATVTECLNFSITLGLIPLTHNVTSAGNMKAMTSQISSSISTASKGGLIAGLEAGVLGILKELGLGDWLWAEILKDILAEMFKDVVLDSAWVLTPVLAGIKYKLHRGLIKKMNRKLGDKAHVVYYSWTEHHCRGSSCCSTTGNIPSPDFEPYTQRNRVFQILFYFCTLDMFIDYDTKQNS